MRCDAGHSLTPPLLNFRDSDRAPATSRCKVGVSALGLGGEHPPAILYFRNPQVRVVVDYAARASPSKAISNRLACLPNPVQDSNPCFPLATRNRKLPFVGF